MSEDSLAHTLDDLTLELRESRLQMAEQMTKQAMDLPQEAQEDKLLSANNSQELTKEINDNNDLRARMVNRTEPSHSLTLYGALI